MAHLLAGQNRGQVGERGERQHGRRHRSIVSQDPPH